MWVTAPSSFHLLHPTNPFFFFWGGGYDTDFFFHILYVNFFPGIKNFPCEVCGKRWFTKKMLDDHMTVHTGERKYQCTDCGACLKTGGGLRKHMVSVRTAGRV